MMFLRKAYQAFLVTAVICLAAFWAPAQDKTPPFQPSLKFQGIDGRIYDLAETRGSVVLISFGATWCVPCTSELRELESLLSEYRGQPVKFYWVSIERPEEITNAELKRYAKERRVTFPVLRDSAKMVFSQFSPRVRLPMILFLSKEGHVEAPVFGMRSEPGAYKADMRARLNKLLSVRSEGDR